jgi:hypothetical protein
MLKKIAIIAGTAVLIIAVLEFTARKTYPVSSKNSTYGKPVAFNSLGLRDREYPIPKPLVKYRIMVLGDANVWGSGLPEEQTLPRLLEKSLGGEFSGIEVLNAACPGFNTLQESFIMRSLSDNYTPDMALLFFNLNDIKYVSELNPQRHKADSAFAVYENDAVDLLGMQGKALKNEPFLLRNLRCLNVASLWTGKFLYSLGIYKNPRYYWPKTVDKGYVESNPGWREAKRGLSLMNAFCAQRGIKFKVYIYPVMADFNHYPAAKAHEAILKACAEMGIDCTDLLPAFKGSNGKKMWAGMFNSSPNGEAQQKVIQAISPGLKDTLLQLNIPKNAKGR